MAKISHKALLTVLTLVTGLLLNACSTPPVLPTKYHNTAYIAGENTKIFSRYAPVIVPEKQDYSYNKIGTPFASLDKHNRTAISIDTTSPTFYVQQSEFKTDRDEYTNLIYRIHFEKVPFSLIPFHLTTGKNVGLLIVVTLNRQQQPVLLTTVHTCGCYVAIIPTRFLPDYAYPEQWDNHTQRIFGMKLPGQLDYPEPFNSNIRPVIYLEDGTHRVMHIELSDINKVTQDYKTIYSNIKNMALLKELPVNGDTTSLYESEGHRKGYVKNSFKPFEWLLMSWWSLDWHVGVDKEYGNSHDTGTVFYTSLKPWRRKESDMWNFNAFLEYWGWNL